MKLKTLLQSRGKTAYWLAEQVNEHNKFLTRGAVFNIVAERANPSLDSISKIMDVLRLSLDPKIELSDILEYDPHSPDLRPPKGTPRKSLKQLEAEAKET